MDGFDYILKAIRGHWSLDLEGRLDQLTSSPLYISKGISFLSQRIETIASYSSHNFVYQTFLYTDVSKGLKMKFLIVKEKRVMIYGSLTLIISFTYT